MRNSKSIEIVYIGQLHDIYNLLKALSNRDNNEAKKLLQWIKQSVSSPRCVSLQDLRNGVVWCRLMAKLRPGSLASVLVIHRPANVGDSLHNYALLEAAFNKINMLWNFDARNLIDGHIPELLRLARRMFRLHTGTENPFIQYKSSLLSPNFDHKTRFSAGELEVPQHLLAKRTSCLLSQVDPMAVPKLPPPTTEHTATISATVEQQLRQNIQSLFSTQQSDLQAYMALQESGELPAHIATANCFCKNCSRQAYT